MRVESKRLQKSFSDLPNAYFKELEKMIRKSVSEGEKFMRLLAPVDKGELKSGISTQFGRIEEGVAGSRKEIFAGSIEAAASTKEDQTKAKAIELGRRKGERGTTVAFPYVRRTRDMVNRKYKGRVRRTFTKVKNQVGLK